MQLLIGVCMFCEDTCSGNALLCVGRGTNRYLRCLAYFPLTCPLPSQPGVGQLKGQETQTESVCVCLCVCQYTSILCVCVCACMCVCVCVCVQSTELYNPTPPSLIFPEYLPIHLPHHIFASQILTWSQIAFVLTTIWPLERDTIDQALSALWTPLLWDRLSIDCLINCYLWAAVESRGKPGGSDWKLGA